MFLIHWGDVLVGMASTLPIPSGTLKHGVRQHRLVILPDFQGLGIGTKVNQWMAQYYFEQGKKYFIRTTHVRLGRSLSKNDKWVATSTNQKKRKSDSHRGILIPMGDERIAYSFEYVGEKYASHPHINIVCDSEIDLDGAMEKLKPFQNDYYVTITTGYASHELTNNWEIAAKELGFRTEVLYIKKRGEYFKKKVNDVFAYF